MFLAITAALLAAGQPANENGDVRCVLDQVPNAERPQLAQDALAGAEAPSLDRLQAAVQDCVGRLGWDADQAANHAGLAVAIVLRDDADATLTRNGISTGVIEGWFAQQSDAFRTNPEVSEADIQRLIDALQGGGADLGTLETHGEVLGVYLGARIMIERAERGLSVL